MLWLVVIVLLALQIVCRAFGAKRYRDYSGAGTKTPQT